MTSAAGAREGTRGRAYASLHLTTRSQAPTPMPHSIIHGDACLAYFNKVWGIPPHNPSLASIRPGAVDACLSTFRYAPSNIRLYLPALVMTDWAQDAV